MKIGPRTPSISKSIKASTTARAKRTVKSTMNPLYGKKGMGLVNDPGRAAYNYVYHRATFNVRDAVFGLISEDRGERQSWANALSEAMPPNFAETDLSKYGDIMLSRSGSSVYPKKGERHKLAFRLDKLESMDDTQLEKAVRKIVKTYGYEMNRHSTAGVPGNSFKAYDGSESIAINIAPTDSDKNIGLAHIRELDKWRSKIQADKTWLVVNRPAKKRVTSDARKMMETIEATVVDSSTLTAMAIDEALKRPPSN